MGAEEKQYQKHDEPDIGKRVPKNGAQTARREIEARSKSTECMVKRVANVAVFLATYMLAETRYSHDLNESIHST